MEKLNLDFLFRECADVNVLIDWLQTVGLLASSYECPKCADRMKLLKNASCIDGCLWRCKKGGENAHDVNRTIRKGTWFERSRLSLREIVLITYMWANDISNKFICKDLHVGTHTVVDWKRFCRDICVDECTRENRQMGGAGKTVEIDERSFGERKFGDGGANGKRVFGAVERGSDECLFQVVDERSANASIDIIEDRIRPGTTIISPLKGEAFDRLRVNYSVKFVDARTGVSSIDGTWSAIKRQLPANIGQSSLDSHLMEYMWKRRHREAIERDFFKAIKAIYPPADKD